MGKLRERMPVCVAMMLAPTVPIPTEPLAPTVPVPTELGAPTVPVPTEPLAPAMRIPKRCWLPLRTQ